MKELKDYYNNYFENLKRSKSSNKTKLNTLSRLKLELYFAGKLLDKGEREEMENKISEFQAFLLNKKVGFFDKLKSKSR